MASLRILSLVLLIGAAVRLFLFSRGFHVTFVNSYEVTTPISSFKRLREGLWQVENDLSPYSGSSYHNLPIPLAIFSRLEHLPEIYVQLVVTGIDVLCAILLFAALNSYAHVQKKELQDATILQDPPVKSARVGPSQYLPELAAAMFLLNPLSIANCVAQSLQAIDNLIVVAAILCAIRGKIAATAFFTSVASYSSPYYLTLVVPLAMLASKSGQKVSASKSIMIVSLLVSIFLGGLLYVSFTMIQSWEFLWKSYGFMYLATDLQPNIGLFWYFFTELFDHFRMFFIFVAQFHVFIYFIPLSIKLRHQPMVVVWTMLAIIAAFKAYPAAGDVALYLAVIPLILHLLEELKYGVVVAVGSIFCVILLPVMWRMWIMTGTGNANFYYALTLVIALGQSMLIADVIASVMKRDFLIMRKRKELSTTHNENGETKKSK